jgi:SAM-dependent methyltransferase
MTSIKIYNNTNLVTLQWNNFHELRTWSSLQLGRYYFHDMLSDIEFVVKLTERTQYNWNRISSKFNLTNMLKIVDVGCGVAFFDLIASQINQQATFFLVDKSENTLIKGGPDYQQIHGHYNNWDVVYDCINSSGLDKDRFVTIDPSDPWPSDIDLVLSTYSWCWHYPKETYWDKVIKNLKIGGILAVDIRNLPDRNVIQEISEEFGNNPIIEKLPLSQYLSNVKEQELVVIDQAVGGFYVWQRCK